MSHEYWLQKKTIGGWSHVTWYSELAEAKINFDRASVDLNGYSWRIVKAEVIEEKMLDEVREISPIQPEPIQDAPKSSGWGDMAQSGWNATSNDPKPAVIKNSGWGTPSDGVQQAHGGAGKVCMINHTEKIRTKVDASMVSEYEAKGYVKGGPRTQFREG